MPVSRPAVYVGNCRCRGCAPRPFLSGHLVQGPTGLPLRPRCLSYMPSPYPSSNPRFYLDILVLILIGCILPVVSRRRGTYDEVALAVSDPSSPVAESESSLTSNILLCMSVTTLCRCRSWYHAPLILPSLLLLEVESLSPLWLLVQNRWIFGRSLIAWPELINCSISFFACFSARFFSATTSNRSRSGLLWACNEWNKPC